MTHRKSKQLKTRVQYTLHLFLARDMLLLFLRSKRSSSEDEVVSLLWMACFFTLKYDNISVSY